jgi:transcriptional regulator with XRE-family HTH domain
MADITQQSFGERLRLKRIDANVSQAQVAKNLGVSQVLISNWESGKRIPNPSQIELLNSLLGPLNNDHDSAVSSEVSPFGVEAASFIAINDGKLRQQVEKILIRFLKSNAVLNK